MELKFNEAKTVRPNHLERCLCYDKFLKGYRCYVYDDISKYWCTQATTEHDQNGDNHIVDYADYQVTEWASLQQEQPLTTEKVVEQCKKFGGNPGVIQPEVDLKEEFHLWLSKEKEEWGGEMPYYGEYGLFDIARHFYELGLNAKANTPKIKGWVARDEDGILHFFSSDCGDGEPIFDKDSGTWGNATQEMLEIVHPNGAFGELSFKDNPIEVELTIHRV